MTDNERATLNAKRDGIVADIDQCLAIADTDSIRALAAIDEARKKMQALWYRIWEHHHVNGGLNNRMLTWPSREGGA